ncbi:membrane integrity-associated transporter subunit PqiC [Acetobacter sp.]|uniref:PqiC family protein n=1 Tax=Acetobacter sp. TaxID=440 RepID=UPI00390A4DF3|nr:PqiC family protein [Acetobacter lovaniensis]MCI1795774.1 PqiC family protein [Acetobacter lovaniensis]
MARVKPYGLAGAGLCRRNVLVGGASLGLMAFTLAGCASSGASLYTLAVVPGQAQAGGPRFVEVRLPSIASGLDRDRIVTADSGYKLSVSSTDAWSDSLASQIGHALAGDLAQRLPGTGVFVENDAAAADPQVYVELSVSRFSTGPSGHVELDAMLSVLPAAAGAPYGQGTLQRISLSGPAGGSTMSMVQGLSQLLGQLADVAAGQIRLLPPDAPNATAAAAAQDAARSAPSSSAQGHRR